MSQQLKKIAIKNKINIADCWPIENAAVSSRDLHWMEWTERHFLCHPTQSSRYSSSRSQPVRCVEPWISHKRCWNIENHPKGGEHQDLPYAGTHHSTATTPSYLHISYILLFQKWMCFHFWLLLQLLVGYCSDITWSSNKKCWMTASGAETRTNYCSRRLNCRCLKNKLKWGELKRYDELRPESRLSCRQKKICQSDRDCLLSFKKMSDYKIQWGSNIPS